MLTLINSNLMLPPIAPLGLDHMGAALRRAGIEVELLDLCLSEDPDAALRRYFASHQPELIGVSFRNIDDCFWPSGASFVPELAQLVGSLREVSDAPIVLGGVGYSIFAAELLQCTGAEFGIRGDGEEALVELLGELRSSRQWDRIKGLLWHEDGTIRANSPAWPERLAVPTDRDLVDNATYFRLGGQIGVETKRGCNRQCSYCVDPLAKGPTIRLRTPSDVADEMESLLRQGVDVFHLCDAEFNLPPDHARKVCDELTRRGLGSRCRWYAYLAVVPFDADLARRMAEAGCVGINFTSDSASATMLSVYGQPHRQEDLLAAIRHCHERGIAVMCDLLLGGPGETVETVTESIRFFQHAGPDCVGTALGLRLYFVAFLARRASVPSRPAMARRTRVPGSGTGSVEAAAPIAMPPPSTSVPPLPIARLWPAGSDPAETIISVPPVTVVPPVY